MGTGFLCISPVQEEVYTDLKTGISAISE